MSRVLAGFGARTRTEPDDGGNTAPMATTQPTPLQQRWQVPAAVVAVVAAAVGTILSVTPPASSSTQPDPGCRAEVTATGPLLRLCEQDRTR
jgi:hypothetical protein